MRELKKSVSTWVHNEIGLARFAWQEGYGAFTVSMSQVPTVRKYIQTQEEHHRKLSFEDEFLALLKRHNIDYDLRYVFETEHVG